MTRKSLIPILCAIILCVAAACTNSDCKDYRTTLPLAGFYSDTGAEGIQAIAFDSLTVAGVGAPGDSLLLDCARQPSQAYLPLPIDARSCSFAFIYATSPRLLSDTITISYTPSPHFASAECGVVYYYDINSISHTSLLIDSVSCLTNPLTNRPLENLRIYFHYTPAPEPLP